MDIKNLINHINLRIARENMGLSTVEVSEKNFKGKKRDVVLQWESGEETPSFSDIEKIAKVYEVSPLLILSDKEMTKNKHIVDFRTKNDGLEYNDKDLNRLIALTNTRQKWIESVMKSSGREKNSLVGKGKAISDPAKLAIFIENMLGVSSVDIVNIKGASTDAKKKALRLLISSVEEKGVFVGKTLTNHKISVPQMRGMCMSNDYAPFILLNRKDAIAGQIFTFVHEIAHLFRGNRSVSNINSILYENSNVDPEEVFCNKVAVNFLLPKENLDRNLYSKDDIYLLADKHKVSPIFTFYRLKSLGKIRKSQIQVMEDEIVSETLQNLKYKEERKGSGGDHNNNMKDSNGTLFTSLVSSLYSENRIGYTEASKLLKMSPESV